MLTKEFAKDIIPSSNFLVLKNTYTKHNILHG